MRTAAAPPRSAGLPGRLLATLAALAVALTAAFVVAPATLAASGQEGGFADRRRLSEAVNEAFGAYWQAGERALSPELARVVDYWFRYHVVKAVIAAALLAVLVALGVFLWKAFLRADRRAVLGSAGVLVTMLALFSLALVMGNVQGAVAPLASLLPMAVDGPGGAAAATALEQLSAGGRTSPVLEVLISDFARYHGAMAVVSVLVAVALLGAGLRFWKVRASSADRRTRRVLGSFGVLSGLVALAVLVVAVANVSTAADPVPALLALFRGGW